MPGSFSVSLCGLNNASSSWAKIKVGLYKGLRRDNQAPALLLGRPSQKGWARIIVECQSIGVELLYFSDRLVHGGSFFPKGRAKTLFDDTSGLALWEREGDPIYAGDCKARRHVARHLNGCCKRARCPDAGKKFVQGSFEALYVIVAVTSVGLVAVVCLLWIGRANLLNLGLRIK